MTQIQDVKVEKITPSAVGNVRAELGDLKELTKSIKRDGILQPLTVRTPKGTANSGVYEMVFGHRRLAAAKAAKLVTVPVIVKALTDPQVVELQLVENIQREDVHDMDEATGYQRLRDDHDYSVEKIMKASGKTKAYIYAALKLCELSEFAENKFRAGLFEASVALYIARLETDEAQKEAIASISKKDHTGELPGARASFKLIKEVEEKFKLDDGWEKVKIRAEKNGEKVLAAATAAKIFGHGYLIGNDTFIDANATEYDAPKVKGAWPKYADLVAADQPPTVHAQDPASHKVFELFATKEFLASVKRIYGAAGYKAKASTMSDADRRAAEKVAADRKLRANLMPLVLEKGITGTATNLLRALLALFVERCTYGTVNNALIKPFEGRKFDTYPKLIEGFNEKQVRDELLVLAFHGATQSEFLNVCKLLKVSPSHIQKAKQQLADDARAQAQAKKEREKRKAIKAKADAAKAKAAKPKPRKRVLKKAGKKKKS